jgi:hypothetical protein
MGGSLTVWFRFRDGSTAAQQRWTNPLPYWMHHPRMFRGDREFVQSYLENSGRVEPQPLAPTGYGLVVVDFAANRLLSMQDYTTFGRIHPSYLADPEWLASREAAQYAALLAEGRLCRELHGKRTGHSPHVIERIPVTLSDVGELCGMARALLKRNAILKGVRWQFGVDTSPLQVEEFGFGSRSEAARMMARLDDLGFHVGSDAETWNSWMAWAAPAGTWVPAEAECA